MATENYTMTNRLLITGMGGFAGSHILEHFLINTDWDIVGIDSWRHKGTPERIEEVLNGHPEWKARVTMITHDLIAPIPERTQKRIFRYLLMKSMARHLEIQTTKSGRLSFQAAPTVHPRQLRRIFLLPIGVPTAFQSS